LALGDPEGKIASPFTTLPAGGGFAAEIDRIRRALRDYDIAEWVVGLPLNMDGSDSKQTTLSRRFAKAFGEQVGQPVHLWDERLSSHQADEYLAAAELTSKQRKARRDRLAAQIFLQSFLDARAVRSAPGSGAPPPVTRLITSVSALTLEALAERVRQTLAAGTDWTELRLDHLDRTPAARAVADLMATLTPGTWVITLRSAAEGGKCTWEPDARWAFLRQATAGREGCIDFEYQARARVSAEVANERDESACRQWILSTHDFQARPPDAAALTRAILAAYPDAVAKVAWMGHSLSDNLVALDILRELGPRAIVVVMGEVGRMSRVLARKFNAAATYCASAADAELAPGQISLDQMLHTYRWRALSATTRVFGVLGDPVGHSLSPVLFNRLFEQAAVDAVYLPLLAPGGEDELTAFLAACERHAWLDIGGFSVTLPHKAAAGRFVGARIEPLAARIGAVNTLAMRDGRLHGCNTDYAGALDALCAGLKCDRADLRGVPVDVLGAGGAARAVVAGLTDCGCAVTIFNRSPGAAAALAQEFDCAAATWEERLRRRGRVVVNCTSVGMTPALDASPLPTDALRDCPAVFDTVYHPVQTSLLRMAKDAGCITIDGVEMFVRQAAAQYRIWFDSAVDAAVMREIVLQAMEK
jgi:3-dehydroquinate dehydratase / shikimate dehydrogenase